MSRTLFVLRPAAQPSLLFFVACLLAAVALAAPAWPQAGDPFPVLDPSIEGREPMDESDELQQGGTKREPMDESDELQDGTRREPMDESDEVVAGIYACAPRVRLEGRAAATLPPLFPAATRRVAVTLASDGWLAFARSGIPPAADVDGPARLLDARGRLITVLDAGEPAWLEAGTYYLELAAPAANAAIEIVAELE